MKIPAALQPLLNTSRRELPSLLKQLQVGQVLPAKVIAQLRPNLVRLQVATTELLARTPLRLDTGTRLRLEVISKQSLPELRILRDPTRQEQQHRAVRTAVARQLPPREIRQAISELRNTAVDPKQTDAVRHFDNIVRESGLQTRQLGPQQLRQLVANSGIFHEARLSSGMPPLPGDIKARLLQLLSSLTDQAPGTTRRQAQPPAEGGTPVPQREATGDSLLNRLVRLIEGSVSRVQLQQSAALPADDNPKQAWQIDLPIHHQHGTDDVMLRIERDDERGDKSEGSDWSVNLVFQFDTTGTVQCRIGLSGDRVATTVWCERPDTHQRVEQRLPSLRNALEAQGLEVVHLTGALGKPPQPLIHVPRPDSLLDERA